MKQKLTYFLLVISLVIPVTVLSQPPGGGPGTPPDVPISGIEWLILAGGALGIKRFLDNRKKK